MTTYQGKAEGVPNGASFITKLKKCPECNRNTHMGRHRKLYKVNDKQVCNWCAQQARAI